MWFQIYRLPLNVKFCFEHINCQGPSNLVSKISYVLLVSMWKTVLQLPCVGVLAWSAKWSERGSGDGHIFFHSWQQTQGWRVRSQVFGVEVTSSSCHSSVSNLKHLPDTCALLHRWSQVKIDKHQLVHVPLVCSASVPVLLLVAVRYGIRS